MFLPADRVTGGAYHTSVIGAWKYSKTLVNGHVVVTLRGEKWRREDSSSWAGSGHDSLGN